MKYAKDHGVRSRKLNGEGQRAWPDRLFAIPKRPESLAWGPRLVEFKKPGEVPRLDQQKMHEHLAACGIEVLVFDNYEDFVAWFDGLLGIEQLPKREVPWL